MPALVDQFSRPAIYAPGGSGPFEDVSDRRISRADLSVDLGPLVGPAKHRAAIADGRYIYHNFSVVSACVEQKCDYVSASGWLPKFCGTDRDYQKASAVAIRQLHARATNKGWTAKALWRSAGRWLDTDGDFYLLKYRDRHGYPLAQVIEAHRVGSRYSQATVSGGPYDGARMLNGVVYSDDGAEIAYQVLGANKTEDRIIPAADMIHIADWRWTSECRPFPATAYALADLYDVRDTRANEKLAQKLNAAIAVVETTPTGKSINANPVAGGNTASPTVSGQGIRVETYEGGMIRYLKSNTGSTLQAHQSNRPSQGAQEFEQTIVSGAIQAIGWRYEMMTLERLNGAGVRGFAHNINTTILSRWELLNHYASLFHQWRVSVLIERGDISAHPDWDKWASPKPREFDVDRGRTSAADIADVRSGRRSMPSVIIRGGDDPEDVLEEQARYEAAKDKIAAEWGVDPARLGTTAQPGDQTSEPEEETESDHQNTDTP